MTMFRCVTKGLNGHDPAVHHARPYSEPDNAPVSIGISRCNQQKHTERGIDTDDHHPIVRVSLSPNPAGGPDNAQRINTEYENQAEDDQRDTDRKSVV